MGQAMSLLSIVCGIRQLQYTLLIILHLHPLLLNTKGAVNIIEQRGVCSFLISLLPPESCLSLSPINATVCEI